MIETQHTLEAAAGVVPLQTAVGELQVEIATLLLEGDSGGSGEKWNGVDPAAVLKVSVVRRCCVCEVMVV